MAGEAPAMALYVSSAGCRGGTSDNSPGRLIAKVSIGGAMWFPIGLLFWAVPSLVKLVLLI